jgi:hypothetical protein
MNSLESSGPSVSQWVQVVDIGVGVVLGVPGMLCVMALASSLVMPKKHRNWLSLSDAFREAPYVFHLVLLWNYRKTFLLSLLLVGLPVFLCWHALVRPLVA